MIFFLIVSAIYFLLHCYLYLRIGLAFESRWWRLPFAIFLLLMVFAFIFRHSLELGPVSDLVLRISAYWVGAVFLFIFFLSLMDLIRYAWFLIFRRKSLKNNYANFKSNFFSTGFFKSLKLYFWNRQKDIIPNMAMEKDSASVLSDKAVPTSVRRGFFINPKDFLPFIAFSLGEHFKSRRIIVFSLLVTAFLVPYSIWEAQDLKLFTTELETDKLPKGMDSLRLAIVADVHINPFLSEKNIHKMVKMVNEQDADIFFSVGDLLSGDQAFRLDYLDILKNIKSKFGKFAVMGNHEYYDDWDKAIAYHEAAGLTLLRGEEVDLAGVKIVGLDDRWARRRGLKIKDAEDYLPTVKAEDKYLICLNHRPEILEGSLGYFDLQISGHTHGGQIFPLGLLYELFKLSPPKHMVRVDGEYFQKSGAAYYPDAEERHLAGKSFGQNIKAWNERTPDEKRSPAYIFTSVGVGCTTPPMRFLTPPEVVIIDIVSSKKTEENF